MVAGGAGVFDGSEVVGSPLPGWVTGLRMVTRTWTSSSCVRDVRRAVSVSVRDGRSGEARTWFSAGAFRSEVDVEIDRPIPFLDVEVEGCVRRLIERDLGELDNHAPVEVEHAVVVHVGPVRVRLVERVPLRLSVRIEFGDVVLRLVPPHLAVAVQVGAFWWPMPRT